MALVEFQNNTAPYINAGNLNNNFQEFNNIVESGSNSNGNYIKYSDGTMICWKNLTTQMAINAAYGNLYQNSRVFDFPQQFIETPVGVCSMFQWGTGASWGCVLTISTTQITCRGIDAISRDVGTCKISYIAIGKWK